MKITTIMPVYNMEEFIDEAVKSWLQQTFYDMELICIDDCSTDHSLDVLRSYAQGDKRIRVYSNRKNMGVGCVRRMAMSLVRGEYIAFLDADDKYWDDHALEVLYRTAVEGNYNIVGGLLRDFNENGIIDYPRFRVLFKGHNNISVDVKYRDFQDDYFFQAFIYKTQFLKEKNIEFPEYRRNEDPPFLAKALYNAGVIKVLNVEYYGHRGGHKTVSYTIESIIDLLNGFIMNLEFADEHNCMILFSNTINRLNTEYYDVLSLWIKCGDSNFLSRLLYANMLASKRGLRIEVAEYVLYLARDYNTWDDYIFTKRCRDLLTDKKKIILYGAGNMGKRIFRTIKRDNICDVDIWVDRYKVGNKQNGRILRGIDDIVGHIRECDYVFVTIDNTEIAKQIIEDLTDIGIAREMIGTWATV